MVKPRSVCVYCGSSDRGPPAHRDAARRLGGLLAESGIELVFGGGRVGLMGIVADAAMAGGGRVTGIIPDHLLRAEVGHARVSELLVVPTMHERKEAMFRRSDAFVVLPGGAGTLDETFEILTWRQLRLHDKPIVIVDLGGYWRPLLDLIERTIETNYARPAFRDLYMVVPDIDAVLPALAASPPPALPDFTEKL
ncbi:MAG: TIGR00730 family Rossman fold protein [Alphaproteobacteria bacterium]|nr:TIGR00730 family Rossman fold protein [Alphaproteobacteria bacterium]